MASRKIYEAKRIERASGRQCRDFSFKVETRSLGLFGSRKSAEKAIAMSVRDFAAAAEWKYGLAGFYVDEYLLDKTLSADDTWISTREARWTYLKDGTPFSYSPFSTDWKDGAYEGTPPDAIMFKSGDWAWHHCGDRFVPVRVAAPPYTPAEWKKKFADASDASDDCYLVMAQGFHDHPATTNLFPMDRPVPARVIELADRAEREYYGGK